MDSIRSKVRHGRMRLVVTGSRGSWRLGGQKSRETPTLFGESFPTQRAATEFGQAKFGQSAVRR